MQDDTQTRLLDRQISRRTMLQVSAVAGASAFLVACGGGSSASEGASPVAGAQWRRGPEWRHEPDRGRVVPSEA